jgi:putative PIN family toxin of toxin-antitoxin system
VQVVIDTSVLIAAIRSEAGASKVLVAAALQARFEFLISTPLVLEYEAVLTRREHLLASGLSVSDVAELLDAICSTGIEVQMTRSWRPQLPDPDDEMVLETALNGKAGAIITFNRADFAGVLEDFGIEVLAPGGSIEEDENRMRTSNFALRLQPALFDAARNLAQVEGVALNQLINTAVAQMIAAHQASNYISVRAKRANPERALEILKAAGLKNPPMAGDELPDGWKHRNPYHSTAVQQPKRVIRNK